ncbi:MAG: hypothetical protein V1758_17315, partial [Pseudomonadota bacterium]
PYLATKALIDSDSQPILHWMEVMGEPENAKNYACYIPGSCKTISFALLALSGLGKYFLLQNPPAMPC